MSDKDSKISLSQCCEGQRVIIKQVGGEGAFKRRLLEMGFLPGETIQIVKYAPLRDPIEFILKGYHVSLRRDEAEKIIVEECKTK